MMKLFCKLGFLLDSVLWWVKPIKSSLTLFKFPSPLLVGMDYYNYVQLLLVKLPLEEFFMYDMILMTK